MPKAVVCRELNQPVAVEDITVEKPRSAEVMIRLVASGVCHSDLSVINGTLPIPQSRCNVSGGESGLGHCPIIK